MTDEMLEIAGPAGPLRGALAAPVGRAAKAWALILPGSGPTDRDGDNELGVKAAPYRLLAEALAAQGVGTLRIDKRGMFGSASAIPDANDVTIEDYAADALAWVAALRARTGAAGVWLIGHSEGGLIALSAAQDAQISGLALLATPGRPLGDVLREQLGANPVLAPVIPQAFAAIEALESGRPVDFDGLHIGFRPLFSPSKEKFLRSLCMVKPVELLAAYRGPTLIVQGEQDLQVTPEDARALAQANRQASLVLLPKVNHVLKTVEEMDRAANFVTYADPDLPLAPGVAEAVAQFILR